MITLSTGTLFPYGLNRIFEIAEEAGFQGIELMPRPMNFGEFKDSCFWDFWDVAYIKELVKKHGLCIASIHTQPKFEENPEVNWQKTVELAVNLDVPNVVCHIPYEHEQAHQRWFWDYFVKNHDYPFTLLAENMLYRVKNKSMVYEPLEWREFPALCFDINHAMMSNQDILELLKLLDNVKEFHISNFDGKTGHQNILENKETFKEIFKLKKVDNYCVEMFYAAFKNYQDKKAVIRELRKIREFIELCTR